MGAKPNILMNALGVLLHKKPARAVTYGEPPACAASEKTQSEPDACENEAYCRMPRIFVALDEKPKHQERLARTRASLDAQSYREYEFGEMPCGEYDYVIYVSEGDVLAPEALSRFARAAERENADILFADEDVCGTMGERHAPYRKPAFNEITFLSFNCVGKPMAVSREVFMRCGPPRSGSATDEYEYALRCTAHSEKIAHIPAVLYSRRVHPSDVNASRIRAAIEAYLAEKRQSGYAVTGLYENSFRTAAAPRKSLKAGILVFSRGEFQTLRRLLESIEENTAYGEYRIAVAASSTGSGRYKAYLELLEKNGAAKITYGGDYARALNALSRAVKCDVLVFLSERAEILSPHWLDALLEQISRNGVGAAGGKLTDEAGRILHAGLTVGGRGLEENPYSGYEDGFTDVVKNRLVNAIRGVDALSGECLMVSPGAFFKAGGFDEALNAEAAPAALCLELFNKGFSCAYTPYCVVRVHGAEVGE